MKSKEDQLIQKTLSALVDTLEQGNAHSAKLLNQWLCKALAQGMSKKNEVLIQKMFVRLSGAPTQHQSLIDACVRQWTAAPKMPYRLDVLDALHMGLTHVWSQSQYALKGQPEGLKPDVLCLCKWYYRAMQQRSKSNDVAHQAVAHDAFEELVQKNSSALKLTDHQDVWLMGLSSYLHDDCVYETLFDWYQKQAHKNCLDQGVSAKNVDVLKQWSVFVYSTVVSAAKHAQAVDKKVPPFEALSAQQCEDEYVRAKTLAQKVLQNYVQNAGVYLKKGTSASKQNVQKYQDLVLLRCYAELSPISMDTVPIGTMHNNVNAGAQKGVDANGQQGSLVRQKQNLWQAWCAPLLVDEAVCAWRNFDAAHLYAGKSTSFTNSGTVWDRVSSDQIITNKQLALLPDALSIEQKQALVFGSKIQHQDKSALGIILSANPVDTLYEVYGYGYQERLEALSKLPEQLEHLRAAQLLDKDSALVLAKRVVDFALENLLQRQSKHSKEVSVDALDEQVWSSQCLSILSPYLEHPEQALQGLWEPADKGIFEPLSYTQRRAKYSAWIKQGVEPSSADPGAYGQMVSCVSTWHQAVQSIASSMPISASQMAQQVCRRAQQFGLRVRGSDALVQYYGLMGHLCAHLNVALIQKAAGITDAHVDEAQKVQKMAQYLPTMLVPLGQLEAHQYAQHKSALEHWFLQEQTAIKPLQTVPKSSVRL